MTPVNVFQIEFSFKYLLINVLDNFFQKNQCRKFLFVEFFFIFNMCVLMNARRTQSL